MTSTFSRGNWRKQQTQMNRHTEERENGAGGKTEMEKRKKNDRMDKNDYY